MSEIPVTIEGHQVGTATLALGEDSGFTLDITITDREFVRQALADETSTWSVG